MTNSEVPQTEDAETKSRETHEHLVGDVRVDERGPRRAGRPSVVYVHGGMHGSWCWHDWLRYSAGAGWHALALNWYGRHGSRVLPDTEGVQRSIIDVAEEIGTVADSLPRPPVVVAHSMGGLAALRYAAEHPVAALVLLTPVVPDGFAAEPTPLTVTAGQWWEPPEAEVCGALFWPDVSESDAERYYGQLVAESPQAVWEAVTFRTPVALERISCPTYVVAAEHDRLVPAEYVRALGASLRAEVVTLAGQGHGVTLDPRWEETAEGVHRWLADQRLSGHRPADH